MVWIDEIRQKYSRKPPDNDLEEMKKNGTSEEIISNYRNMVEETSLKEEVFFSKVGVDKNLFKISHLGNKGSGDDSEYSFLALSLRAFDSYGIKNVSGVVNINTDPSYTYSKRDC